MKFLKGLNFGKRFNKRFLSIVVSISLLATILPLPAGVSAAETTAIDFYGLSTND